MIPAVLSLATVGWLALAVAGIAATGAGSAVWYVKDAQVARLQLDLDRASEAIADRDKAVGELQRAQRTLTESISRQNGAIESLATAGRQNAETAAGLLDRVREGNRATVQSIASLAARMTAPGASTRTCLDAVRDLRQDLLK